MKKTLIALLAAAGLAMGATPMDVTWNNNSVNYNSGEVSAVFTLDIDLLTSNEYDNNPLLTFDIGYNTYGVMSYYEPEMWGYPSITEIDMYDPSNKYGYYGKSVNGYKSATIGYTYNSQYGSKLYLALIDDNGEVTEINPSDWYGKASENLVITSLTKNSLITQIDIYENALSDSQMHDAMFGSNTPGDTPDSPTIPEPATATLSLLALAGLAARRRRK